MRSPRGWKKDEDRMNTLTWFNEKQKKSLFLDRAKIGWSLSYIKGRFGKVIHIKQFKTKTEGKKYAMEYMRR